MCGCEYIVRARHQKYCSNRCRVRGKRGLPNRRVDVCTGCGERWTPPPACGVRKLCPSCKARRQRRCVRCSMPIDGSHRIRFCERCADERTRRNMLGVCACGEPFVQHPMGRPRKYCGTCSPEQRNRWQRLRSQVLDRDGWTCYLCHQAIDYRLVPPDMLCGTADHVVPLVRGGATELSNLKACHFWCNIMKRGRLLDDPNGVLAFAVKDGAPAGAIWTDVGVVRRLPGRSISSAV
jgi:hypothetical protein